LNDEVFDQRYVGYREFSTHRDEIKGEIANVKIEQAGQKTEIAHVNIAVVGVDKKIDAMIAGMQSLSQKIERQPAPAPPQSSELLQVAREIAPMLKKNGSVPWWLYAIGGAAVLWIALHYLGIRP
jgi:hypothetical protein